MGRLELLKENLFAAIDRYNLEKVKKYVKKARKINRKNESINGEKDGMKPIHRAVYIDNFRHCSFCFTMVLILMLLVIKVCINPFKISTRA